MPVNPDDLLLRADAWPHRRYDSNSATGDLIADLADALRAALATQSQPLFEGTLIDFFWEDSDDPEADNGLALIVQPDVDLGIAVGSRIVVYAAEAGSATPTDPLRHAAQAVLDEYEVHDWFPDDHPLVQLASAVPGSATPTGDDDE